MKQSLIILVVIASGILGYLLTSGQNSKVLSDTTISDKSNSLPQQTLNLIAKQGYTPQIIEAKANQSAVLRITTNNTFDCSSALRIPALNISKQLNPNGITEIPIPGQLPGSQIAGTCGMGMYSFTIKFT